jgi:tetratricopeptide (TPR) repeat protein
LKKNTKIMKTLIFPALFFLLSPYISSAQVLDSTAVTKEIDSLIQTNRMLIGQQELAKALEVIEAALSKTETTLGKEHPAYALCVFNRGRTFHYMANYDQAESSYKEALLLQEKVSGKEHSDYAAIINGLGVLYMQLDKYTAAEPLYLESKEIRLKLLGREHPDYAWSFTNLANLYAQMGKFEVAESYYQEAISLREGVEKGTDHPVYASSLDGLANLYTDLGKYDEAEALFFKVLSNREKTVGIENYEYSYSLNNLANLYTYLGKYEQAEPLYLAAKNITDKTIGKENPDYISTLNNLAILYSNMGNYEKSEMLYLEAKVQLEKINVIEHSYYASVLANLAGLYRKMGNFDQAETFLLEAISIEEKLLGRDHIELASTLNNLANLYLDMGNYKKAESFLLEAKNIREKQVGKGHPDYAINLNNLGTLYHNMGDPMQAENLYLESQAIWEKEVGKENSTYAKTLYNLADVYNDLNQKNKAESFYLDARDIWEQVVGTEHPDYINSIYNLGAFYWGMDRFEQAAYYYEKYSPSQRNLLVNASRFTSERELADYTEQFLSKLDATLSYTQLHGNPKLWENSFDNALFYKGFLLNSSSQIQQGITTDTTSKNQLLLWRSFHRRLAKEYAKPLAERKEVVDLEEKANTLEKEMARSVAGFGEALRQVNWQEVQSKLKPGEAVIEFIHYKYSNPNPTDSILYAALLLKPGMASPEFIPLFEERQLHKLLSATAQSENIAMAYASRGLTPKKKGGSIEGLYQLVWEPLKKYLNDVKKVYYSPSGLLHRINFDAIPINKKENIFDNYRLTRLGSSRSLVVPYHMNLTLANNAILYGGIEYELDDSIATKEGKNVTILKPVSTGELSFTYADRSLSQRGENWQYLPGTKEEVNNIAALLKQSAFELLTYSGTSATEESFKKIGTDKASPRILHLATHGFFFPDPKEENPTSLNAQTQIFKISDHPMIRSGLILAGGNHVWEGRNIPANQEDGILTSYEISQMNLSNTELVVLSACETGLGDIEGNEGVYGLQRAFKIAGVKYLIMSIWQVPDQHTQELMTTFYTKWLEGGMEIPEAFQAAQQEMRKKYVNPYFWAGFILLE